MKPSHLGARVRARRLPIAAAGTAVLASLAMHAGTASASSKQVTLMADPYALQANPAYALLEIYREAGARGNLVLAAPNPLSMQPPIAGAPPGIVAPITTPAPAAATKPQAAPRKP